MSRLSRQDYHGYTAQAHPRWSPSSPPLNRLSAAVDPRLAPRLGNPAQQDLQQTSSTPQLASSQLAPPTQSLSASSSNADVVQAVNAMSSQVTSQLSMMGTQLASLVSLTSRLIELSQINLAAADSANARTTNAASASTVASNALGGAPPMRADASPANATVDLNRSRVNGNQTASPFPANNVASANNATRSDSRQAPFYQNAAASNNNNFRNAFDSASSTLDRTFGSTLRGASPTPNPVLNSSLSAAAARPAQQQQQQQHLQQQQQQPQQPQLHTQPPSLTQPPQQTHDANDLLKSRLPSPVFPDDPIDLSTGVSSSGHQTPANLKRLSTAGGANDSARKANTEASLGDWKGWLNRTWHAPPGHQSRNIKYRTMQQARRAHRDQTKRSMATLGRLPLKEFLEIRPEQYLGVRKTGRKLYQEWLLQEVRLAKQPEDRVKAAINRLENDHPELGDCEDHWKAKQLLQQIIDNAIDEANLHRKKEARASNAHQEPGESTPRNTDNARSTSMMGMSASSSSSALADADRSLRSGDSSISLARKGNNATGALGAGANKNAKGGVQRRKADQAELDDTPSRFRQPPSQRNSMLGPGGSDDATGSSLQAQQASLSSSGLEAAHSSGRGAILPDYAATYSNDSSTIASATSSDALQASRQHASHGQHMQPPQHAQHHTQHQPTHAQDQTHNAWASQTAAPGPSLFGQSNYTTTAAPPTLSHHQPYGHHSNHHHNSSYLSSDPGQTGLGASSSGLLDDQRHQSHLSPMVNGGSVRMHQPHQQQQHHAQQAQQQQQQHHQQQPQSTFFDNRGYQ
ncbi:conserved hypothetical protein [Sporisorium reilianum SRZ2]|uniref:Uncharacterized protein n=1 Tax=Sporisorium reilianum (strain SRZ2) TaxID=999809 RepID=E6ZTS6_SPORE|nr:conserved hypothetical protein [Sporisorium reilianum SRZ2]